VPESTLKVLLILQLSDHSFQLLPSTIVGHAGKLHTTPPLPEEAAVQTFPIEAVHGLFVVQVVILELESLMSIVVSELIMLTEPALELMERSLPWKKRNNQMCRKKTQKKVESVLKKVKNISKEWEEREREREREREML